MGIRTLFLKHSYQIPKVHFGLGEDVKELLGSNFREETQQNAGACSDNVWALWLAVLMS